jgi:hypothetical protein
MALTTPMMKAIRHRLCERHASALLWTNELMLLVNSRGRVATMPAATQPKLPPAADFAG